MAEKVLETGDKGTFQQLAATAIDPDSTPDAQGNRTLLSWTLTKDEYGRDMWVANTKDYTYMIKLDEAPPVEKQFTAVIEPKIA